MINNLITRLKKNDKHFRIIFGAVVIGVAALILGAGNGYLFNGESTDDAFIDGHVIAISPKVSGHIARVYVKDNQEVNEGDALFDIDDRDYVVQLNLVQADLNAVKAEFDQAQKDFERYQKLKDTGDISEQRYDEAVFHLRTAEAKRDGAQARLKQAELNVSYTKVIAPAAGQIARKNIEPGAFVQAGQVLAGIVSPERWVTANFKETQLTHMHPGQKAVIRVDAFPSLKLSGHVDSIQEGTGSKFSLLPAENATGNFIKVVQRVPVKIVFDNPPTQHDSLPLGLSVISKVTVK